MHQNLRRSEASPPPSRSWKAPFLLSAVALFAATGGIALAAQTPKNAAAPAEVDCTLVVPANPLTAVGLASPYRLTAPCHEADPDTSAFVQATVIDPATGKLSVYNPLVVDEDANPAAPTVTPQLPAGAVVGIWFGFNGDNLTLRGSGGSLSKGACVNGLKDSIFGQFAYCGAPTFFATVNKAIAAKQLDVPAIGDAKDGGVCPTTRDFGLVDMDQSDNVTATYLFLPDGRTAQNTAANQATLARKGAKVQVNGSDEGLLDNFVLPALDCTPFTAPDLADPGHKVTSLALNEIQASVHQAKPVALVPSSDPMTLVDGKSSLDKTNLYRAGVDMAPIDPAVETPRAYCQNLVDIGVTRTKDDADLTKVVRSPNADEANSLFTFLTQRLNGSFTELGCAKLLKMRNPVTVIVDAKGVAVDAKFATTTPSPSPSASTSASRPAPSSSATRPSPSPSTATSSASTAPAGGATSTAPAPAHTTPPATSHPQAQPTTPAAPPPTHAATPRSTTDETPPAKPAAPPAVPPSSAAASTSSAPNDAVPVAGPIPSLTLGPVPVRVAGGLADNASDNSPMPLPKIAGIALLSIGVVLGLGAWLRAIAIRRRERWAENY